MIECDICNKSDQYAWRIDEAEKDIEMVRSEMYNKIENEVSELKKADAEIRTEILLIRKALDSHKNILIATLTSTVLSLIGIVGMFISKG